MKSKRKRASSRLKPENLGGRAIKLSSARKFLARLDPTSAKFHFRTFTDDEEEKKALNTAGKADPIARNMHGSLDKLGKKLSSLNKQGAGVFVVINEGGQKKVEITRVRAVFADQDTAGPLVDLGGLPEPHIVVKSSPGKYHLYWLCKGLPIDRFTAVQKGIIAKLGTDPVVHNLSRVMRVPGFIHQKRKLFRSRIVRTSTHPPFTSRQILDAFVSDRAATTPSPATTGPAESFLIPTGKRNCAMTRIAGFMRREGLPQTAIESALSGLNTAATQELLPAAEIAQIAASVATYPVPDPRITIETLNDAGNADRLIGMFGADVRYVPEWEKWIKWDGKIWRPDDAGNLVELAKRTAKAIFTEAENTAEPDLQKLLARHANASLKRGNLSAMIALARSDLRVVLPRARLDCDDDLLAVENGVIDLRTGVLAPASREHFITRMAPVKFDATAKAPTFVKFIRKISRNNKALKRYLIRVMGYCLTGQTSEQCFFFLYGNGGAGKSTFLYVLRSLLGPALVTQTPSESLMAKPSGRSASNDIARLDGFRVTTANEVEEDSRLAEALIKQLTGQDAVTARFLYKEFQDFEPKFKLLVAGNYKPVIRGTDDGIWRRIHLIPFAVQISKESVDLGLRKKLRCELPGILNIALRAARRWYKDGLKAPKLITTAVGKYRSESDIFAGWLKECAFESISATWRAAPAYESYADWAKKNGLKPMSGTTFGKKLGGKYKKKIDKRGAVYLKVGPKP